MDLFCPHCTKRVSVPDDKSGQVMSCPLCAKQFMAPSLAPPPAPPPAPPYSAPMTSSPTYESTPASPPFQLPAEVRLQPLSSEPAPPPAPPPAPLPPGEYTRMQACCLRAQWLMFVPPGCMVLILFVLSFFNWSATKSLWGLSFNSPVEWQLTTYSVLLILSFLLTLIAAILDTVPLPPVLVRVVMWKNLFVAMFLGLAFLFLAYDFLHWTLASAPSRSILMAETIALRLHAVAILASFGMFWLHLRKQKNLPPPKLEAHW